MKKVVRISEIAKLSKDLRGKGKKVGLIVGCFDILHLGHINLFRFAKRFVDFLIVGLDNDETIRLVKGKHRPINNFKRRSELLSDLITVDKIFEIKTTSHYDSEEALESYKNLVITISPTHIFTHKVCDAHWKAKKEISNEFKLIFKADISKKITNSGKILKMISSEL